MAKRKKKSRRQRRPNIARQTLQAVEAPSPEENMAETYAYVISDLRRSAIIAAAMLAVLVGLSFVLN